MFIWFAVMAMVLTFVVFQSPAIDYRLVALGAVIPLVEVPWGNGPLHSLAAPTLVLALVMVSTIGRRLVRRRWLGVPIGMYLHLVLDLSWTRAEVFWWPVTGIGIDWETAPVIERWPWSLLMEGVALLVGWWAYRRAGLEDTELRRRFVRTGQLDRSVMGPSGVG